jgi:hypothetical protein
MKLFRKEKDNFQETDFTRITKFKEKNNLNYKINEQTLSFIDFFNKLPFNKLLEHSSGHQSKDAQNLSDFDYILKLTENCLFPAELACQSQKMIINKLKICNYTFEKLAKEILSKFSSLFAYTSALTLGNLAFEEIIVGIYLSYRLYAIIEDGEMSIMKKYLMDSLVNIDDFINATEKIFNAYASVGRAGEISYYSAMKGHLCDYFNDSKGTSIFYLAYLSDYPNSMMKYYILKRLKLSFQNLKSMNFNETIDAFMNGDPTQRLNLINKIKIS